MKTNPAYLKIFLAVSDLVWNQIYQPIQKTTQKNVELKISESIYVKIINETRCLAWSLKNGNSNSLQNMELY